MRFGSLMAALAFGALVAACGGDSGGTTPTGTARLRLVNGSPTTPAMDLRIDNQAVISNVSNTVASTYIDVPAGQQTIAVAAAGSSTALASTSFNLHADQDYTLYVGGIASPGLWLASDTGRIPAAGKVKFRLVHTAPAGPDVDPYLTAVNADLSLESPVITPFDFGVGLSEVFPGYIERDPGQWQVRFTTRGTKTVLLNSGTLTLSAGDVYDIMLINGPPPDSTGILGMSIVKE